nr:MAG TPA: hypothetical protein [Caudoviricetes sp.]
MKFSSFIVVLLYLVYSHVCQILGNNGAVIIIQIVHSVLIL